MKKIDYSSGILYKARVSRMPTSFLGVRIVGNHSKGLGLICFPVFSRPNRRATMRYLDRFYTTPSTDRPLLLSKEKIVGKYSDKELDAIRTCDYYEPRMKRPRVLVERDTKYQQEHAAAREKDLEDFYKGKHNRYERSWKTIYRGGGFTPR